VSISKLGKLASIGKLGNWVKERRESGGVCRVHRFAAGAGYVDDNLGAVIVRFEFTINRGHAAQELRADVSKHGGAFGGDAVFREDLEESGEEEVDLLGGLEVVEFSEKIGGKVAGVGFVGLEADVAEAEAAVGIECREAAACALLCVTRALG
jgi:hypothetical protein